MSDLELPKSTGSATARVYLAAAIVLAAVVWFLSRPRAPERAITDSDVGAEMAVRAAQGKSDAEKTFGITLDDSPESVAHIEQILGQIHDRHAQSPLSDQELTKAALQWGAYVGEVICSVKPAQWKLNSDVGGAGSLPIVYEDMTAESFPVRWCYNRIVNGEEENVWHKFSVLVLEPVHLSGNELINSDADKP
jgi:hypothetical protein